MSAIAINADGRFIGIEGPLPHRLRAELTAIRRRSEPDGNGGVRQVYEEVRFFREFEGQGTVVPVGLYPRVRNGLQSSGVRCRVTPRTRIDRQGAFGFDPGQLIRAGANDVLAFAIAGVLGADGFPFATLVLENADATWTGLVATIASCPRDRVCVYAPRERDASVLVSRLRRILGADVALLHDQVALPTERVIVATHAGFHTRVSYGEFRLLLLPDARYVLSKSLPFEIFTLADVRVLGFIERSVFRGMSDFDRLSIEAAIGQIIDVRSGHVALMLPLGAPPARASASPEAPPGARVSRVLELAQQRQSIDRGLLEATGLSPDRIAALVDVMSAAHTVMILAGSDTEARTIHRLLPGWRLVTARSKAPLRPAQNAVLSPMGMRNAGSFPEGTVLFRLDEGALDLPRERPPQSGLSIVDTFDPANNGSRRMAAERSRIYDEAGWHVIEMGTPARRPAGRRPSPAPTIVRDWFETGYPGDMQSTIHRLVHGSLPAVVSQRDLTAGSRSRGAVGGGRESGLGPRERS